MYRVVFLLSVVGAVGSAPNFLVVLTDDQDLLLDGLVPMNETLRLLADEGAALVNAVRFAFIYVGVWIDCRVF